MDLFTLVLVVAIFGGLGFLIVKIVQAIVETREDKKRKAIEAREAEQRKREAEQRKAIEAREAEQRKAEKARIEEEKARKEVHRNTYGPHRFTLEYSYNDTLEKVDIESGGQKILNNSPEDKLFFETVNKNIPYENSIFFYVKIGKFPNVRLAIQCTKTVTIITNKAVYRYNDAERIDKTHDYIENIPKYRHRASGYMQPIQYAQKLLNGIINKNNYYTRISKDVFGDSHDLAIYETYLAPSLRSKVNPTDISDILAAALAD